MKGFFNSIHILPNRKKSLPILHEVIGIIKPGRMTLLLGPSSSGTYQETNANSKDEIVEIRRLCIDYYVNEYIYMFIMCIRWNYIVYIMMN
nr:pleiotropic drug resistance protein 1-like [Ipomoea batatas]